MGNKKLIPKALKKLLEKQHYEFAGNHTAVKICEWTKKSLRDEGFCYKEQFYGIKSHRCCQMSPTVNLCSQSCIFCWRPLEYNLNIKSRLTDKPKDIIDNCINAQRKKLSGFWGNEKVNKRKLREAMYPNQFAISLSGEPTFYSKLDELIKEIKSRGYTAFLVSNGTNPKMLEKLIRNKAMPTQMYITLPAPNEEVYKKVCNPLIKSNWKNILKSLKLLSKFKRSTIRLTLVKELNMINPEQYAELIKMAKPNFIECKAYMFVGSSRQRLNIKNMPRHHEIMEFAKKIAKKARLKIIDEKKESRVVLLAKKDFKERVMKFY